MANTIGIIEGQLRTALAGAIETSAWPIRWPNEPWASGINLTNGNLPTKDDGTAAPYVEVENLCGKPFVAIGLKGGRVTMRLGLMRVHLVYPQNLGMVELTNVADDVEQTFTQQDVLVDLDNWQRLTTENPTVDDKLAVIENGNRVVRTVTVPWRFFYRS